MGRDQHDGMLRSFLSSFLSVFPVERGRSGVLPVLFCAPFHLISSVLWPCLSTSLATIFTSVGYCNTCHNLGGLEGGNLFLTVLEAGRLRTTHSPSCSASRGSSLLGPGNDLLCSFYTAERPPIILLYKGTDPSGEPHS